MKCPNCQETIEDDALYCKFCGEDIKIVPDFELDFDFVAEILAKEVMQSKEEEAQIAKEAEIKKNKQKKLLILCSVCAIVLISVITLGLYFYTQSYNYQISRANASIVKEDYENALHYLEKAYQSNSQDIDLLLDLCELYFRTAKTDLYTQNLQSIIEDSNATDLQLTEAYTKLIAYYDSREDYLSISTLLAGCEIDGILLENRHYIALEPQFSYPEGKYESMVPLKLSSNTAGNIYFTTDGSVPTENTELLYTAPLFLEAGEHVIRAIFVNEYGLVSPIVTKEYIVDLAVPEAPEVFAESGEYTHPTMIEILVFQDVTVYYTDDGSFPTEQSKQYKGPIPMPLGRSTFRFVGYNDDGIAGEITQKDYYLTLDTELTTDTACYDIIKKMIEAGKISDTIGTAIGLDGWYKYQFQYPVVIEGYGEFYVIAELFQDIAGNREKTGTYYGVNINDRQIYKLSNDESGNYLLEGF